MKAKRRHDLKENLLANELVQVKEFLNKYGTWILIAIAAVAVGLWAYNKHTASKATEAWNEKIGLTNILTDAKMSREERAKNLDELAETAKDPLIAAEAGLTAGSLWSQMYRDAIVSPDDVSEGKALEYRKDSRKAYERVLAEHAQEYRLAARAHYGLAVLEENMAEAFLQAGDIAGAKGHQEAAKGHYGDVAKLLGTKDPTSIAARERARRIDQAKPIRFATTLPSPPAPTTAPGEAPAPATAPAEAPAPTTPTTAPAEG